MKFSDDQTFCKVIQHVLTSEGNYVNNPHDAGGPTMYGIAWNYNADYLKAHCDMIIPTDIKHLTLDQAKQLYFEKYWLDSKANGISSINLAYVHLDTAVNCGVGTASHILTLLGGNPKMIDGKNGANKGYFTALVALYVAHRLRYYARCPKHQTDEFGRGWMNRAADVLEHALSLKD